MWLKRKEDETGYFLGYWEERDVDLGYRGKKEELGTYYLGSDRNGEG